MAITRWSNISLQQTSNARITWNGATVSDATYTLLTTDVFVAADATSSAQTLTLPAPVGKDGKIYFIKRINTNANNISIVTTAGNIDGQASLILSRYFPSVILVSNGTNWISLPDFTGMNALGILASLVTANGAVVVSNGQVVWRN